MHKTVTDTPVVKTRAKTGYRRRAVNVGHVSPSGPAHRATAIKHREIAIVDRSGTVETVKQASKPNAATATATKKVPAKPRKKLALLLLAHNEELGIATTIKTAIAAGQNKRNIFVVDNDSGDDIRRIAIETLGKQNVLTVKQSSKNAAIEKAVKRFKLKQSYRSLLVADANTSFADGYFHDYRKKLDGKHKADTADVTRHRRNNWITTYDVSAQTKYLAARARLAALSFTLFKRSVSLFVTLAVTAAAIVLLLIGAGYDAFHLPVPSATPTSAQAVVKTKLVATPSKPATCDASLSQSNSLFTSCPSFSADFSKLTSVNSNDFNVYNGAPIANHEDEYYTDNASNVRVQNGSLILEAQDQSDQGYDFTSGRIDTHGKEDFLYGKIVIRATLPTGIGTWPAIWMLPSQPKYYLLSPASDPDRYKNDGEIDIAESVGTMPHVVYGAAHTAMDPENGVDRTFFNTVTLPDNSVNYHNYEVDWTPTSLTYSIDGQVFFTYTKPANATWQTWPFNQPSYLTINLALGGSWGGTDTKQFPGNGVDKSALPASIKVQSINYYSYTGAQ